MEEENWRGNQLTHFHPKKWLSGWFDVVCYRITVANLSSMVHLCTGWKLPRASLSASCLSKWMQPTAATCRSVLLCLAASLHLAENTLWKKQQFRRMYLPFVFTMLLGNYWHFDANLDRCPFSILFSRSAWLSQYQKGKPFSILMK